MKGNPVSADFDELMNEGEMYSDSIREANEPVGSDPHDPDPHDPRPLDRRYSRARSGSPGSASAASGTVNEFSNSFWSSLIRSGYRFPGSTVTAKTSCMAVSNRKSATTCPVARSIAQTPKVRWSSTRRSVIGMTLKTALLRT